jgi:hypothetical protein
MDVSDDDVLLPGHHVQLPNDTVGDVFERDDVR